jgi:putative tryptophan/tyrosine transport system substrate-binding protein
MASSAACPVVARGQQQQAQRTRRVCMLNSFAGSQPVFHAYLTEFYRGLSSFGWENGRNLEIVERWANGDFDRAAVLAKELVAMRPDVILAVSNLAATALQRETSTIPVVFLAISDPVALGLVVNLSRPSGNFTGTTNTEGAFGGKLVSLLKRIAPPIRVAAALFNPKPGVSRGVYHVGSFEAAANNLGIEPIIAEVHSDVDIEQVIDRLKRDQGGAVVIPDVFMNIHRSTVIASSIRNRVPVIYDSPTFAKEGGLIQYGPNFAEVYRHASFYVDQILRGAKPGDLPVELPTKYGIVINLKTARAIGLDVSADMISIADEVIE